MFFSKALLAAIVGLSASMSVHAHSTIVASQQLANAAQRGSVTRGGTCNSAEALKNPIPANNGQFVAFGKSFNGGRDGATTLKTATVDTSAQGKAFTGGAVTEVSGGNPNGGNGVTAQITYKLPNGVKCAGGADKSTCLVEITTVGGFGACLAVTQKGGATAAAGAKVAPAPAQPAAAKPATGNAAAKPATGNAAAKPAAGNTAAKKTTKKGKKKGAKKGAKKATPATAAKKANRRHARDFTNEADA